MYFFKHWVLHTSSNWWPSLKSESQKISSILLGFLSILADLSSGQDSHISFSIHFDLKRETKTCRLLISFLWVLNLFSHRINSAKQKQLDSDFICLIPTYLPIIAESVKFLHGNLVFGDLCLSLMILALSISIFDQSSWKSN